MADFDFETLLGASQGNSADEAYVIENSYLKDLTEEQREVLKHNPYWTPGAQHDYNAAMNQQIFQDSFNANEAQKNRDWQEYMSNTSYSRAMEDLKRAGVNPYWLFAGASGGASSGSGSAASAGSGSAPGHGNNSAASTAVAIAGLIIKGLALAVS